MYLCTLTKKDWEAKCQAKHDHRIFKCFIFVNGVKAIGLFAHSNKQGIIEMRKGHGVLWNSDFAAFVDRCLGDDLYNSHGHRYEIYFHGCCDGYKQPIIGGERNVTIRPLSDIRACTCTYVTDSYPMVINHTDGTKEHVIAVDMYA